MKHYVIEMIYSHTPGRSGWFFLEAKDLASAVRDIPNHNPDGEVVRVEEVTSIQAHEIDELIFTTDPVVFIRSKEQVVLRMDLFGNVERRSRGK